MHRPQAVAPGVLLEHDQAEPRAIGPLANANQFQKVQALIQKGIDEGARVAAGGDARAAAWHRVADLDDVSWVFDHAAIAARALAHLRAEVMSSDLARALVPEAFSQAELRAAVDAVRGTRTDAGNFRKRFLRLEEDGTVVARPGRRITGRRPARVWSFSGA